MIATRGAGAALAVMVWLAVPGCLDSLVGGECRPGWSPVAGRCQPLGAEVDAAADANAEVDGASPVCTAPETWCDGACSDTRADPDHCGGCGRACASGICRDGACLGATAGHVVLIGHDYTTRRAALDRVLGNAVALGTGQPVRVAVWTGEATAASVAGTEAALTGSLSSLGRTWRWSAVGAPPARAAADVFLACAQPGPAPMLEQVGAAWGPALTAFVADGGVVVVLVGPGGATPELVRASGLLDVRALEPVDGAEVEVTAPGDAIAIGVPSPYLAMAGSTSLTDGGAARAVVRSPAGDPIVLHLP